MEMKEITPQSISANARTPRYADAVLLSTAGRVMDGGEEFICGPLIKQVLMSDVGTSKSLGAVCDGGASFNASTSENCFVPKPHVPSLNASAYTLCVKFRNYLSEDRDLPSRTRLNALRPSSIRPSRGVHLRRDPKAQMRRPQPLRIIHQNDRPRPIRVRTRRPRKVSILGFEGKVKAILGTEGMHAGAFLATRRTTLPLLLFKNTQ
ncbi:hypothetical protein CEXT_254051 [Caerostris extrusa]|uniref:Uncharacterized protein n=1 Tax=Caerostris extrusa TaxID=172846 RepID=A0AAV4SME4_CAEEX|nr:hypothetical protein CEXT_254051 [Caerostris extrusa]